MTATRGTERTVEGGEFGGELLPELDAAVGSALSRSADDCI